MILHANLASATPASYDGTTLELAFPPGKAFAVKKVQSKEEELKAAFTHVFGTSPAIRCVARAEVPGTAVIDDAEDAPASKEEALARLREQLGGVIEAGE